MSKKNKGKKVADPNETSKLLAAKISQLEQDAAGEKDQEAEIGASVFFRSVVLSFCRRLGVGLSRVNTNSHHCRARGEEGHQGPEPTSYHHRIAYD